MTEHTLSDDTRAKLKTVSTASIATALFKRGLRNQFIQGVVPVAPKDENMVGQAFTLRYIPAREDRNPITVFRNPDQSPPARFPPHPFPGWDKACSQK